MVDSNLSGLLCKHDIAGGALGLESQTWVQDVNFVFTNYAGVL